VTVKDFGQYHAFENALRESAQGGNLREQPELHLSVQPKSFNQTTLLGRTAKITHAPTAEQIAQGIAETQTVAYWQGLKVKSQAMTIDVGTVITPDPGPRGSARPSARPYVLLQYGADGNMQNVVQFDAGTGRRATVIGNYISVSIGMDPPLTGQPSAVMTWGGSIAAFAAASVAPLFRSVYCDDLAAGVRTGFLHVPLRADTFWTPAPTQSFGPGVFTGIITIDFFDFGGNPVGRWTWDFSAAAPPPGAWPVPPDAFLFTVLSSVNHTFLRVPFQLSL